MSIDRSIVTSRPDRDPLFAHVKAGMTVIIEDNGEWWMADVISSDTPGLRLTSQSHHLETGIRTSNM